MNFIYFEILIRKSDDFTSHLQFDHLRFKKAFTLNIYLYYKIFFSIYLPNIFSGFLFLFEFLLLYSFLCIFFNKFFCRVILS